MGYVNNYDKNRYLEKIWKAAVKLFSIFLIPCQKQKKMYDFLALCALSVYPVCPSTAKSLSTVEQTLMQIYEILCEDNGKLVVQIFLSRIIIVCLEICVEWHIPVCFHIKSPTPIPSHGVQYSININDLICHLLRSYPSCFFWNLSYQLK